MGRLRLPIQPVWYSLLMGILTLVIMSALGIAWTARAIESDNQKLCAVLAASLGLDGNPQTPLPPTRSEHVAKVRDELAKLYEEFHCTKIGLPPIYGPPSTAGSEPTPTPS